MIEMIRKNILEILLVTTLLVVSGVAHGYNMFHFPYYENDEGVYMSQAWSVVETGELAPYTYWYDHAPAGWFFIAIWTKLTGGFFTFGMSVNSGRVFMLVLHVVATALLYYIARRLGGSKFTATIATLLFALTPLGLYFHRRVLLDNIMTFWVLAALAILLVKQIKLRHILTSGIMFGIAVLTKENAVFFGPAFLFLVYIRAHHTHRRFAILQWLVTSGMVVSLYFVYALMKNEFFPSGTFGSGAEHVSLLGTLDFQASREAVGSFWDFSVQTSEFWLRVVDWAHFDMLLVGGGILVLPVLIVMVLTKRYNRWVYILIFLLNALQWLFLARGGIILEFYIVPLMTTVFFFLHQIYVIQLISCLL